MARKRREITTANQIWIGDTIQTPNGLRGTIDHRGTSRNCTEPNVALHWQYPTDHSVNASHRGQSSGRIYRPTDEVTRWI